MASPDAILCAELRRDSALCSVSSHLGGHLRTLLGLQATLAVLHRHALSARSLPPLVLALALRTSWAPALYPFTLGSHFFLSPQLKQPQTPKKQEQELGSTHPCLDGAFVLVTSLATVALAVCPWAC